MLRLPPTLTHAQAPEVLAQLSAGLSKETTPAVDVDCSALSRFDSSALAVLLGLHRLAASLGKRLAIQACPTRLTQLATVYGVASLLALTHETVEV